MLAGSTSIVSAAAPIVMATQSYTEQHALSAMTTLYLNKKGFQIEPKTNIATTISRNAMINKQINMTWEYTGTSLIIFNHINKPMSSEEDWQTVKNLDARLGLVWLNPAPMNDTYAFAMQRKRAEKEHIDTLSQLVAKIEKVRREDPDHNWTLGLDLEFAGRADGLKLLQKVYNMPLDRPQIRQMDPGLVYTTDGRVKGFDLKVLKDDKGFFPSYAVTPVLTQETQDSPPGLEEALNALSPLITNEAITEMNKRVDIDHQSPQQVGCDFLKSKGLL
ncbi:glycine/betaine ABC transporter substrate-binding protein [Erwinia tracheiphila]|nr:glycine betaine ABC transporter substrate-binding protein [Erwinia tracheiphila]UIA90097.1 glycine/betaine ABC transporter substrate-binding protein [Erwinia tracheiphila]UIA98620.1 glycine/betaine ABC transporter substrate-binding protein [Erwinia tracheiphila]